ncbi:hypothetical protein [Streptomyces griseoflavus]|uniref:hypothetical protein n=1 Tax=Streptomyces griseoflavus TaxID=35619 RepID=UPI0001B4BE15|nr:hypothetical protein [Streptomyces griseoflavus]
MTVILAAATDIAFGPHTRARQAGDDDKPTVPGQAMDGTVWWTAPSYVQPAVVRARLEADAEASLQKAVTHQPLLLGPLLGSP